MNWHRISFSLTTRQFLDDTKTVTRRLGWRALQIGDRLLAVEKCMGLKKGEKQSVLGTIEIVAVSTEKLNEITQDDVVREGFDMTPAAFVKMFREHMKCKPDTEVTRIEFRRVCEDYALCGDGCCRSNVVRRFQEMDCGEDEVSLCKQCSCPLSAQKPQTGYCSAHCEATGESISEAPSCSEGVRLPLS